MSASLRDVDVRNVTGRYLSSTTMLIRLVWSGGLGGWDFLTISRTRPIFDVERQGPHGSSWRTPPFPSLGRYFNFSAPRTHLPRTLPDSDVFDMLSVVLHMAGARNRPVILVRPSALPQPYHAHRACQGATVADSLITRLGRQARPLGRRESRAQCLKRPKAGKLLHVLVKP